MDTHILDHDVAHLLGQSATRVAVCAWWRHWAKCREIANKSAPVDLAARHGEENLAFILPETNHDGTMQFARQLGEKIRALHFGHSDSAKANGVTISRGVCSSKALAGPSTKPMMRTADAQLHLAKAQGRGRACGSNLDA